MMTDLNDRLDGLMQKHGIPEPPLARKRIEGAIREIVSESVRDHGNRIMVRGLKHNDSGIYAILDIISEYGDIVAVADRSPFAKKARLLGGGEVDILDIEAAQNIQCDVCVVNSIYQGQTIASELMQTANYYIVDLYNELRVRGGIAPGRTLDEYKGERDFSHNKTHEAYLAFQNERDLQHLKTLMGACLSNRDFVTFYEVVGELENQDEKDGWDGWLSELKADVCRLLHDVKAAMDERMANPSRDIIIHWIDSAGFKELDKFPRLSEKMRDGVFFENAYAVAPYTVATEACIFYPDEMNNLSANNPEEIIQRHGIFPSEVFKNIIDGGYDVAMTGYMADECMPNAADNDADRQIMVASSVYYWNMINMIIHSEKPVMGFIGCLSETHEPWMSPKTDPCNPSFAFNGRLGMSEGKIKESALYYDKTLSLFSRMFCEDAIQIYMSDHGKWEDIDIRRYDEYAMHTILGVTNLGIRGSVTRIFSYKYFAKMLYDIMRCANKETEELIFGDSEIRSEGFKAAILSSINAFYGDDDEKEQMYSDICTGYAGIKTLEDTYIRMGNGREIYFLNEDSATNRIGESRYAARIRRLAARLKKRQAEGIPNVENQKCP